MSFDMCQDTSLIGIYCDIRQSINCYLSSVREVCCKSCESKLTNISDCLYGDKSIYSDCNTLLDKIKHRKCYREDVRETCCGTCNEIKNKYFAGCWFGDNATDCAQKRCQTYDLKRRQQCCHTCTVESRAEAEPSYRTPRITIVPSVTTADNKSRIAILPSIPNTDKSNVASVPSDQTTDSGASYIAGWVIPAAVGGVLLVTLLFVGLVVFCWKRKRPSAITEETYRDYKITKRSPMPKPRGEPYNSSPDSDTALYAYANPNDVATRNGQYSTPSPASGVVAAHQTDKKHDSKVFYLTPIYGEQTRADEHGYLIPSGESPHYMELQNT